MKTSMIALTLMLTSSTVAAARGQTPWTERRSFPDGADAIRPSATSFDCSDGLVYDDGTFETPLKPTSVFADLQIVMRLDPGPAPARLERVCTCWGKTSILESSEYEFDVVVYDDDGPGGTPGTLLGRKSVRATGITGNPGFHGFDVSDLGITLGSGSVYVGVDAVGGGPGDPAFCGDTDGPANRPVYSAGRGGSSWSDVRDSVPSLRAVGVRAGTGSDGGGGGGGGGGSQPPPPGPWLTTGEQPGFDFKVRVTPAGGAPILGNRETRCISETLCASGALPGRPEVFVKVIGPRPNGFLWVQISRFTPSQVEVWVRQVSTGDVRYYRLAPVAAASDDVSGAQDRRAFSP